MEFEALTELIVYSQPRALRWESIPAMPPRDPSAREESIAAALSVSFSVLSSFQIARRFMPKAVPRTVRSQLHELAAQGWARRAHLICAGRGQTPRLFVARDTAIDACGAVRALHANAWFFALERLVPDVAALASADADLAIDLAGSRVLIEIAAWRRSVREALLRHDRGAEPVVFVLPDEGRALAVARFADRTLRHARERCFFAAEPDIHLGRLRALILPRDPGGGLRLSSLVSARAIGCLPL